MERFTLYAKRSTRLCLPVVRDHEVDEANEILTDSLHARALHAAMRALEKQIKQIRCQVRITEPCLLAKLLNVLELALLVRLNHAPRRMVFIW